jgi:hypothetical protein
MSSYPAKGDGFLRVIKVHSITSLGGGSKAGSLMSQHFTARLRILQV